MNIKEREELVLQYKAAKAEGDYSEVIRLSRILSMCPDCDAILRQQSGCVVCLECGWSQCQ